MILVYVGDGISSESPFATQYYNNDPTGDLQFRLVFAVYGDQFYKFIMQPCILVTAAVFFISSVLLLWTASCQIRGHALPPFGGVATSACCICGLFIFWVIMIRSNANDTITRAIDDRQAL